MAEASRIVRRHVAWSLIATLPWMVAGAALAQQAPPPAQPAQPPPAAAPPATSTAPATPAPAPSGAAAPPTTPPVPQGTAPAPGTQQPAAATPAPQGETPAGAEATPPAPDATPAPATEQPAATPPATPPPPSYGELAPQEEPEIKEGDWDPWAHSPSNQRHDGFFLRIALGFGGGTMSTKGHILSDVNELDLTGGGLGMSIGIGGALTDNLILYGDIFQMTLFNPDVEVDGDDVGDADSLVDDLGIGDEARVAGLGIGLNYYFMPINIYVGGSIGFGRAIFEDSRGDVDGSDLGVGLDLTVGKEWWVGNDWGLGVAGQFLFVSTEDDTLGDVQATAFSVLFSATYN